MSQPSSSNTSFIWHKLMTDRGRRLALITFTLVVLVEVAGMFAPYGLGRLTAGISQHDWAIILSGLLFFGAFEVVKHLLHYVLFQVREFLFQENFWSLPDGISQLFYNLTIGQLINRSDAIDGGGIESLRDKIWTLVDNYLFAIIPNFASIVFGVVICFIIDPLIGFMVVGYIILERLWSRAQNRHVATAMEPVDRGFRRWHRRMRERWDAVTFVKWNGVETRSMQETKAEAVPWLKEDDKIWRGYFVRHMIMRRFFSLGAIMLIGYWLGSQSLVEGVKTASFVWLLLTLQQMFSRLQDVSDAERAIERNQASITGYRKGLEQKEDFSRTAGTPFTDETISLTLEHISLSLGENGNEKAILKNVSLKINAGERVAIVGPSGAGKSQLTNLILRAYDPTAGMVKVNDTDIRDLSLETFSRYVGYIPQDMSVFEGSVRENVAFGLSHHDNPQQALADDERVWNAINMAGLNFSGRLTEGLETGIGFKGMKLSGGQKQRLTIATALFKRPKLVVADEATSSLDSVSEAHVLEQLYTTLPPKTTLIMVAHRLSTLVGCHKIIFVEPLAECTEDSNVRVYPCFESLYDAEPIFRELADAQGFQITKRTSCCA